MTKWGRLGSLAFTLLGGAALASGGTTAGVGGPPYEVEEIEVEEYQAPAEGDLEEVEETDIYQQDSLGTNQGEVQTDDELQSGDLEEIQTEEVTIVKQERGGIQRGPYVLLGGGVDGFTGGLSNEVDPGLAWGATAGVTGGRLGFELGYSGSANEIDSRWGADLGSGADLVRNSGQAAVKLNITKTALHPYVLGGVGIERYSVRNGEALGFQDDTNGYIPAAAGLRWNIGSMLTADARVSYNFMFDDEFAPGDVGGNRLQGLLTLGGTY